MVRSHIGNVVCRKALCVRVASSPPKARRLSGLFSFYIVIPYGILQTNREGMVQPMKRTEIRELYKRSQDLGGQQVTVCGWVRTIRDSKALGFIDLNDGSCFKGVQVVFEEAKLPNFKEIAKVNVGAALVVTGELLLTPEMKQPFEIHAQEIAIEGASTPDYPLQKKRHSLEFLRTVAHLRPRTNTFSAAFRVRSAAAFALHKFFQENGFVYAHTPIITGSDCEGAGEMFHVTSLDSG